MRLMNQRDAAFVMEDQTVLERLKGVNCWSKTGKTFSC